jgi:hypothetical protein
MQFDDDGPAEGRSKMTPIRSSLRSALIEPTLELRDLSMADAQRRTIVMKTANASTSPRVTTI